MSLIAYKQVVQFRRQAAKRANLHPRRLSFTGFWDTLTNFLLHQSDCDAEEWERRFEARSEDRRNAEAPQSLRPKLGSECTRG